MAAARQKLLNTSSDLWTNEDRAIVGAMLRQRIAAERERAESGSGPDSGGNLADQLARALEVDVEEWRAEIPLIQEWFDKIGDKVPTTLLTELDGLRARLG